MSRYDHLERDDLIRLLHPALIVLRCMLSPPTARPVDSRESPRRRIDER